MIVRFARLAVVLAAAAALAACASPFAPQYEYEEQLYLSVDGRATVVIDSSLHALIALRGADIDPSPGGPIDRELIRTSYESANCDVDVSRSWTRKGRHYVQVVIETDDVRTLSQCGLLAWSSYALTRLDDGGLLYQQAVGPPAKPASEPKANWDGSEVVAFRLHLPSRIRYHNVKLLNGENGTQERGNILTWEQRLTDRRAGVPLAMRVDMDSTSILNTTLWIFGSAFAAAVLVLVLIIWMVIRRGKKVTWTTT